MLQLCSMKFDTYFLKNRHQNEKSEGTDLQKWGQFFFPQRTKIEERNVCTTYILGILLLYN